MKNRFINSTLCKELLGEARLVVVDGGARGALFEPFDKVDPRVLSVIRFEADIEAEVVTQGNDVVVKKGLWSEPATLNLHVAEGAAASSVYPPDQAWLSKYEEGRGHRRRIRNTIEIEVDSIDNLVKVGAIPPPDFIKLDIHGAEYEALMGAQQTLKEHVLGVSVETWSRPIHEGQRIHADVEIMLNALRFYLYHETLQAGWMRAESGTYASRREPIAGDYLYLKEWIEADRSSYDLIRVVKHIAIADLFGFTGLALQLNRVCGEVDLLPPEVRDEIGRLIIHSNRSNGLVKLGKKAIGYLYRKYI